MAGDDRTEKATSRRRQKAYDEGQFAYSQEATATLTLLACLITISVVFVNPAGFRAFFENMLAASIHPESDLHFTTAVRETGIYFLKATAPIFGVAIIAALAGNVVQGLPMFNGFSVKFDRLNPISGLSRLKTKISPLEWGKILIVLAVGVGVTWAAFRAYWPQIVASSAMPLNMATDLIRAILTRIVTQLGIAMVILAVADFFLQRYRFEKNLMMTKAEVKEDMKAQEGNPTIKGKIRAIARERARKRMMARLKEADVIVTNPTHFAVALEYKPGSMGAPRVVAKGRDWLAQIIKDMGREFDIPTVENVPLARALYRSVEVEQEIPAELYKAVAEVLAFVFRTRNKQ